MRKQPKKTLHLPHKQHSAALEEDPNQHLWAVSYTDLLMVLLSFFVIYFRFDDVQQIPKSLQEVVKNLSANQKFNLVPSPGAGGKIEGGGDAAKAKDPTAGTGKEAVDSQLAQELRNSKRVMDAVNSADNLMVNLPDDFYDIGQYKLSPIQQQELTQVLEIVRPYSAELSVIFVGHTDAKPMVGNLGHMIDSNLALSTLRAVKAVEHALSIGFDPRWLSTQGVGEHERNARSLSIKIISRASK